MIYCFMAAEYHWRNSCCRSGVFFLAAGWQHCWAIWQNCVAKLCCI